MIDNVKKRIYCFDLLKILAILAIIAHHIMMDMYVLHPMHNLKFVETFLVGQYVNVALMATAMFMMLSGATLALKGKEEEPIAFYKKRLIRLLIPFYFAYIIYFVIRVINEKTLFIFGGIPKWRFIFTIIGMDEYMSANGVRTFTLGVGEWFLGAIMLCYLVYPFLYRAHKKHPIITFVFMTVYNIFMNLYYPLFNFKIVSYMNFLCQVYNFYLGIVLIDKKVLSKINKKALIFSIPVLASLFLFNFNINGNFKVSIAISMMFIIFYSLEEYIEKCDALIYVITFFNKISLEIYLVHHFVIYQVDYMLSYKRLSGIATLGVISLDFAITIMLALLVEKLSRYVTGFVNKSKN